MLLIRYPGRLQGYDLKVSLSNPAVPIEFFQLSLELFFAEETVYPKPYTFCNTISSGFAKPRVNTDGELTP